MPYWALETYGFPLVLRTRAKGRVVGLVVDLHAARCVRYGESTFNLVVLLVCIVIASSWLAGGPHHFMRGAWLHPASSSRDDHAIPHASRPSLSCRVSPCTSGVPDDKLIELHFMFAAFRSSGPSRIPVGCSGAAFETWRNGGRQENSSRRKLAGNGPPQGMQLTAFAQNFSLYRFRRTHFLGDFVDWWGSATSAVEATGW